MAAPQTDAGPTPDAVIRLRPDGSMEGAGWLASIAGAMLILFIYHVAIGRRGFRV